MVPPRRARRGASRQRAPEESPGEPMHRWLREDPFEATQRLAGELGARPATSLEEAKAAAYLDGRLRRAGMSVAADPFRAVQPSGWDGLLVALPALLAVGLYFWLPLPSLLLTLWNLALATYLAIRGGPMVGRRRASQNVVATRAANEARRWRVLLVAPLDSPPVHGAIARRLLIGRRPALLRLALCAALALLAGAGVLGLPLELVRRLWLAQVIPALGLLLLALAERRAARAPGSPGAISHAGALAVLLYAAEALGSLEHVELWAAALGSTATGAGAADLLRRYPFDRRETLVIGLEGIGAGSLCFVTDGDGSRRHPADPLLVEHASGAGAHPQIEVGPRTYYGGRTLAGRLRGAGMRSISIMCLDAAGRVPLQGSADDTVEQVDAALLERAARFVDVLVRRIDTAG